MDLLGLSLVGFAIALGLAGIVVPVLPGLLLIWAAVGIWALSEQRPHAWVIFTLATLLTIGAQIAKVLIPGRRLQGAGVPRRTLLLGAGLGVIGFFVIPVVGLPLGFVTGIYLTERLRQPGHRPAWQATVAALRALSLSILIEMAAGLLIAGIWLAAVIFYR